MAGRQTFSFECQRIVSKQVEIIVMTLVNLSFYHVRYNSGSKHLLNYLLFGFCELLTSEIR